VADPGTGGRGDDSLSPLFLSSLFFLPYAFLKSSYSLRVRGRAVSSPSAVAKCLLRILSLKIASNNLPKDSAGEVYSDRRYFSPAKIAIRPVGDASTSSLSLEPPPGVS